MLRDYDYPIKIIRSQRQTTQFQIAEGQLVIRTDQYTSEKRLAELIEEHRRWIEKKMADCRQRKPVFKLLGQNYDLIVREGTSCSYELKPEGLYCQIRFREDLDWIYDQIYQKNQKVLIEIIKDCLAVFPKKPAEVRIKRLERSFGICRPNRKISISLYVLKYSVSFMRMIVFHELCHLEQMDHSAKFYALLEQYVPDHRQLRKEARNP